MRVSHGPTGRLITGHVLDVARAPLEARLRDYSPQLYLCWNSKKLRGHGLWEVRYRPETKSVRKEDVVVFRGNTYVSPKFHELDMINHVLDVPFLNYKILERIKAMDTWNSPEFGYKGQYFAKEADYLAAKHDERIDEKSDKELQYNLKQLKSEMRWFKDYLLSGGNPAEIGSVWDKS